MNGNIIGIVNEQTSKGGASPTRHLGSSRSLLREGAMVLTMVNRLADRRFCEEKGDGFSGGGAQPTQALSASRNSCLVLRNATHRQARALDWDHPTPWVIVGRALCFAISNESLWVLNRGTDMSPTLLPPWDQCSLCVWELSSHGYQAVAPNNHC